MALTNGFNVVETEGVLTKTAAYTPIAGSATDVSGFPTSGFTALISVSDLEAASGTPQARFVWQESQDGFVADIKVLHAESFQGPIVAGRNTDASMKRVAFRSREVAGQRFGTASTKVRVVLEDLNGTSPTVTYRAWFEVYQ